MLLLLFVVPYSDLEPTVRIFNYGQQATKTQTKKEQHTTTTSNKPQLMRGIATSDFKLNLLLVLCFDAAEDEMLGSSFVNVVCISRRSQMGTTTHLGIGTTNTWNQFNSANSQKRRESKHKQLRSTPLPQLTSSSQRTSHDEIPSCPCCHCGSVYRLSPL
eukprot:m.28617 g.28617  ORF g.28617 m.28617 type:complete len:160 (+) comp9056_c1_seq3:651-1130(+)